MRSLAAARMITVIAVTIAIMTSWGFGQDANEAEALEPEIVETAEREEAAEDVYTPAVERANDPIIGSEVTSEPPKSFLTTLGSWIVVFVVFCASIVYMKKKGFFNKPVGGMSEKHLSIVETTALGNRQFLVLAKVRDREVLLGVGQGFISKLESIPENSGKPTGASFEESLDEQAREDVQK